MSVEPGYVESGDRDAVAFLLGEAVASRNRDPQKACVLARAARAIADQSHKGMAEHLPEFESALPTHHERVWGAPVEPQIVERLASWIDRITHKDYPA